jgi:hypothetical protein
MGKNGSVGFNQIIGANQDGDLVQRALTYGSCRNVEWWRYEDRSVKGSHMSGGGRAINNDSKIVPMKIR